MNEAEVARFKAELDRLHALVKDAQNAAIDAAALAGPFRIALDEIEARLDSVRAAVNVMRLSIKPSER